MAESVFIVASIAVFAVIGMLTGWIHGHGEIAGTICGGLAGYILAVIMPGLVGTEFLSKRRHVLLRIAIIAWFVLLLIVMFMYAVNPFRTFGSVMTR